jgi:hypothetical protein
LNKAMAVYISVYRRPHKSDIPTCSPRPPFDLRLVCSAISNVVSVQQMLTQSEPENCNNICAASKNTARLNNYEITFGVGEKFGTL